MSGSDDRTWEAFSAEYVPHANYYSMCRLYVTLVVTARAISKRQGVQSGVRNAVEGAERNFKQRSSERSLYRREERSLHDQLNILITDETKKKPNSQTKEKW